MPKVGSEALFRALRELFKKDPEAIALIDQLEARLEGPSTLDEPPPGDPGGP